MRVVAIAAGTLLVLWFALSLIIWSITIQTIGCLVLGLGLMAYGLRTPRD
jgi:hypothetical protein